MEASEAAPRPVDAAPAPSTGTKVIVLAAALAAALAYAFRVGLPCLRLDESFMWWAVRPGFAHFFARAAEGHDCGGFLYGSTVRLAMSLFGDSETALRVPGILFGMIGTAFLAAAGGEVGGRRGAVLAAALGLVHPLILVSCRMVKGYGLVFMVAAMAAAGLVRQAERADRRAALLLGLSGWLAVLSHGFGAAIPAGLFLGLVVLESGRGFRRSVIARVLRDQKLLVAAIVPALLWQWRLAGGTRTLLDGFWNRTEPRQALHAALEALAGDLRVAPIALAAALLLILLPRGDVVRGKRVRRLASALAALALPPLLAPFLATALARGNHNFILARYFIPALPAAIVFVAMAFSRLPRLVVAGLVLALFLHAAPAALRFYRQASPTGTGPREIVAALVARHAEGERVFLAPGHEMPTVLYYGFDGPFDLILRPGDWQNLVDALGEPDRRRLWVLAFDVDAGQAAQPLPPDALVIETGGIRLVGL